MEQPGAYPVDAAETPAMFDQSPIEERHAAIGVFTAIALAGAGALHLLITGGFAPLSPRLEPSAAAATPLIVSVVDAEWAQPSYANGAQVTPTSYTPDDVGAIDEPLAGDRDVETDNYARTQDDIERDIEALYADADSYNAEASYADASYSDDEASVKELSLSAYENASPW